MAGYPGNFVDSGIITVPNRLRTGSNAPTTKLAYITPEEEGILQALKPGTPHKGPMGIPNYDSFDWDPDSGSFTGGSDVATSTSGGQPSADPWQPQTSQAVEDEYDEPDKDYEAKTQADINAIIQNMQEAGTYTATPGPAEGTGIVQAVKDAKTKIAEDLLPLKTAFKGIGTDLLGIFSGPEIQRLTPAQLRRVKKILADHQALGITDPNKLRAIMASNIGGGIFGKDQRYSDMEGNIVDPDKILFEGDKMFITNEKGQKVEVRRTKEGTTDFLKKQGSDVMKSLQKFHPELYYPYQGMPQTTGGLESLGQEQTIDLSQFGRGTKEYEDAAKYNQMIFEARQTLGTEKLRQDQAGQGGGAGITNLAPAGILSSLPDDAASIPEDSFKPGVDPNNPYGLPDEYMGWYDSPFNIPGAGGGMIVPITLPDGTVVNMPDTHSGNQFQQYLDSLTTTPATTTTPMPFNYAQWPQFGPAGGPVPNYVNQGLGVSPQFNYWNQIANTFPGMR